jgi:hypothetical protein
MMTSEKGVMGQATALPRETLVGGAATQGKCPNVSHSEGQRKPLFTSEKNI